MGARRLEHLRYLAHDPLVARLCGLARIPTDRTVVNWLKQFTQEALQAVIALNSDLLYEQIERPGPEPADHRRGRHRDPDRRQIELFLKALKQNLKIKTFVGTSANALKVQVWTALIALLVLKYLQLRSTFGWSLSNLVALLQF